MEVIKAIQGKTELTLTPDPQDTARASGLRYVSDTEPGIRRRKSGTGFAYYDTEGRLIHDRKLLRRFRSLAIPPAWAEVWICPYEQGHIQATGRDARGRKQYRYHPRWNETRGQHKYDRMIAFGYALPAIRQQVNRDLSLPGLPRSKVLAAVVYLMDRTGIRVGNEEYRRANESYGLTTLQDHHVAIEGATLHFRFRGKSGLMHEISLTDQRLARIVRSCRELPGSELFQYVDEEGKQQAVDSGDVNEYLRGITQLDFSSKDFRTWAGTVEAAVTLQQLGLFSTQAEAKHNIMAAYRRCADRLRNRPATCRKHYVHPAVIEAYQSGSPCLMDRQASSNTGPNEWLYPEEKALLDFLECQSKAP